MNIFKRLFLKIFNNSEYKEILNTQAVNAKGDARICADCSLRYPENIYIGKGSFINGGRIYASPNAKIVIGENCMISYEVHMRTSDHNYLEKNTLIKNQGMYEKDIIIGDDVWIGYGAQIMAGVHIATGSVIGAGAVLTHNTEEYGVYVGVPAKLIKYRQ